MKRRRCFWAGVIAVGILWILLATLFLRQVPRMEPIKAGIIEEFWEKACGTMLDPASTPHARGRAFGDRLVQEAKTAGKSVFRSRHMIYGPFDDWYVYERRHMHGSDLFRVPGADVRASFGRVIEVLEKPDNRNALEPAVRGAMNTWEKLPETERSVSRMLQLVQERQLEAARERAEDLHEYYLLLRADVQERWIQSSKFGMQIVLEALYLGALTLFICWPLLRGKGSIAWAIHLGMTPFLFMLPAYLGYATMSFSSVGESGGVAYPWLLGGVRGSWFPAWDLKLFHALPKVLEPLSQTTGFPVSMSWRSMPGPATTTALGFLLAGPLIFVDFIPTFNELGRRRSLSAGEKGGRRA